ncbi:MAG: LamG-like jellyroll fold domain-containing protein [Saprospiraceae bacterium]
MKSLSTLFGLLLVSCPLFCQITFQQFPKPLQLYPRDINTNIAQVQISGTAFTSADSLIFTLEKSDGGREQQAFALSDLVDNQFDMSFVIAAGLWSYQFKVETKTANNLVLLKEAGNVVAGDVFAVEGQSNAQAFAFNGDANIWQNNFVRCFGTSNPAVFDDTNWYIAEGNGFFTPGAIGQWALRMGYLLQENLQIPIAIINGADPGKPIEFFQRNDALHNDSTTNYGRLLQRLNNAGLTNHVRSIMYYQGESDGARADIHKTLFEALHADWEENYPNIEAYYIVQVREGCGAPSLQLRDHQRAFEDYLNNAKGVTANGINGHDGCHYDVLGYGALGEKIYKQISAYLYNTPTGEQTNVRVISASFTNDLNTQITVVTDASTGLTAQAGSASDFTIQGASAAVIGIHGDGNKLILDLDQSVNTPNAGLSYGGHSGSGAWVLNADGYGMFTFYNLLIDNYHIIPNFDIPGIMSGSGNCVSFDGIDDFVNAGSVLNTSYTKEAWINWPGGTQANNIISGGANTAFWLPNGVLSAGHNQSWWQVTDNVTMTPNQWTHVAVSYDNALGELTLYKNGKLVSQAQNIPAHNDPQAYIGAFVGSYTFRGKIDEVRIWDRARTIGEIRTNMCQKLQGTEPGLVSYFRFDETAGGIAPNATSAPAGQLINFQGLGLNEAWHRSGAPIGTKSNYTYEDVDQISLSIASGDSLVLSTAGVPDFVHLYFVEEVPNVLEPAADYLLVDNANYFGLFYVNQSINNYELEYNYSGNPFAFVQEPNLGLLRRKNNAQAYWEQNPQFIVNQAENTVASTGTIYQEYILAIKDSVVLAPLSAQLLVAQTLLCSDLNNGVIIATAQGGQAPYTFRLNNGAPQTSGVFSGLAAGNYTILVMDQLGSTVTTNTVLLQSPDPLIVSVQVIGNDVLINIEGGTSPYSWSSNAPNPDLQNLPNGSYTLAVVDANGCMFNALFIIDYHPLEISTSLIDLNKCDGLADLVILAQGGEPPYQYSLNNSAFQTGNTFQNLYPGDYEVLVMDANGQQIALTHVEIILPSILIASATVVGETIAVISIGGTSPYVYSLDGAQNQPDSVFIGLAPGEYSILMTDAAGCTAQVTGIVLTSGILTSGEFFGFTISPNPSTGIFKLQGYNTMQEINLDVWDVTGRLIQSAKIEGHGNSFSTTFDLMKQADGIYLLRIRDGKNFASLRLIKMR